MLFREGENQYGIGIIKNPSMLQVQLRGRLKIDEVGSKEENRLVIIFSCGKEF